MVGELTHLGVGHVGKKANFEVGKGSGRGLLEKLADGIQDLRSTVAQPTKGDDDGGPRTLGEARRTRSKSRQTPVCFFELRPATDTMNPLDSRGRGNEEDEEDEEEEDEEEEEEEEEGPPQFAQLRPTVATMKAPEGRRRRKRREPDEGDEDDNLQIERPVSRLGLEAVNVAVDFLQGVGPRRVARAERKG